MRLARVLRKNAASAVCVSNAVGSAAVHHDQESMSEELESPLMKVVNRIIESRFTGLLRVRAHEADGEMSFLAGIREETRFGLSKGDDALARMRQATIHGFEVEPRLPALSGDFKKKLPLSGTFAEFHPATLMRHCETNALTCTLALEAAGQSARIAYKMGELLSVQTTPAGSEVLSRILQTPEGTYSFTLPELEFPPGVTVVRPSQAPLGESARPKPNHEELAARRRAAEEALEAQRKARQEAEARRKAEQEAEARRKAEQEAEARRKAEQEAEEARRKAEQEAEARRKAEQEAEARRKAEQEAEEARRKAEQEAEEARRKAEQEAEEARRKAEQEAEEARRKAEQEAEEARRAAQAQTKALEARTSDAEEPAPLSSDAPPPRKKRSTAWVVWLVMALLIALLVYALLTNNAQTLR